MNTVKAELSHNPYLLETKVKFNGHEPKINSMVEKYRAAKLQSWTEKLPDIFYNEMNGWDFDLDFSGTAIDFECLQSAFDAAGANRDSVCLFHKNELEPVERKSAEIADLLTWFEKNPNRKFAFADFRQTHAPLFDADYSFVVVQGPPCDPAFDGVPIVNVPDVKELEQAELENTPILFYISEKNRREFMRNLTDILQRGDVGTEQLFFCINPDLNHSQVEREIRDLGVECPQIVGSPSDDVIKRYLAVYPMTAYVQQVSGVLRGLRSEIGAALQAENERSIKTNGAVHQEIDSLDEVIQKLKSANEKIAQRDNFEPPTGLQTAKADFMQKILNWRKKKIKMTSDEEARKAAAEFTGDIQRFFKEFISQVDLVSQSAIDDVGSNFFSTYDSAGFGDNYRAAQEYRLDLSGYAPPDLVSALLALKSEGYEEQAETPFGLLKNVKNMWGGAPDEKELVKVVTYLCQDWREIAEMLTSSVLDEVIQRVQETLRDFYERVAEDYLGHLKALIERQTQIKDEVSAQLSDDERQLQADNDWFAVFQEKLREIERD
jgi:hypothetical protein